MFYNDVGLLPGILVFFLVVLLYRLITFLISRSQHFKQFVEGRPTCIIKDGLFMVENFKKEPIAMDELFAELRLHSIAHLGQVEQAIMETNGKVNVYFIETMKFGMACLFYPMCRSLPVARYLLRECMPAPIVANRSYWRGAYSINAATAENTNGGGLPIKSVLRNIVCKQDKRPITYL